VGAELLAALALLDARQRAGLTSGTAPRATTPAPPAGLSAMVLGDGPLGLVSPTFDERDTALLLPCGTALAATWDPGIVRAVGRVLGSEAARRGFHGVFAPNINLPRTGLSGRSFEMWSEDPLLTGMLAAEFAGGVQSQGVAACPKHLVCNDTETERQRMSASVDEASLREVYLRPFEIVLKSGAWMVMAAYNRLNGIPCTEHAGLFGILKREWGWDGLVMSDYFALKQTVAPALAGLDLEMPGPPIHFGERLADAVAVGQVPQERVDDAALRLLRLASRVGALDGHDPIAMPGEHIPAEQAPDVLAAAAAASFTLVRNDGLLPLQPGRLRRIAVIGLNAARPCYQGATFGRVRPAGQIPTPWQAIRDRFAAGCEMVYEPGVPQASPQPLGAFPVTTPGGVPGVLLEHRTGSGRVVTQVRRDSAFAWFGEVPGVGPTTEPGSVRLTAVFTPERSGRHVFAVGGTGDTTVSVDGRVLTGRPAPPPEDVMGVVARAETSAGEADLAAGVPVTVVAEMRSAGARVRALTVSCLPPHPGDAVERAVRAAEAADAVVLVVGDELTTSRESRDLPSSALPGTQTELVRRVAVANPRTAVIVNAGRPVDAPWADDVAAVLYAWLPGQGFGDALARVLVGDIEPAGRLPVTIPLCDEDRSTWGQQLDDDLSLDYTATEPTGYRHLQRTGAMPRFAFGHGLGYTTWSHDKAECRVTGTAPARQVEVAISLTNTGQRTGREVVQVYVRGPGETDARLAGFTAAVVGPGETADVTVVLDEREFARWDTAASDWSVTPGTHQVLVGRSAVGLTHTLEVSL
jgi:beta-glucosidase